MDWRDKAACLTADPELFFPVGNTGPAVDQIEKAKAVCARCPVVSACRAHALASPQLYRLMTARPLDRDAIGPGSELAAMAGVLALFGEDEHRHDVARAAWAWVHGLVTLEIAQRFPPGADLDAAWDVLIESLSARVA